MNKHLSLWQLIWQQHRKTFCQVVALNLLNALVNVATIAFINRYLLNNTQIVWQILPIFLGLIILLLLTTFVSQYALTKMGHQFVFDLRTQFIKRILDTKTAQLDEVGSAKILASLSGDIQSITMAFVRLPELVQGVIICLTAGIYLGFLSLPMLIISSVWIGITIWVSGILVNHVYQHLENLRHIQDDLYQDYQSVIDGRKELALNRYRAKYLFEKQFLPKAEHYQEQIIKADSYHLSAVNWSNIMMFASIGLVFVLAPYVGLTNPAIATTFCLTILFIQSPLLKAVGAYPVWQTAKIALQKMQALSLADYQTKFETQTFHEQWQEIALKNVHYQYQKGNQPPTFQLTDINFNLKRGEIIFLIGANGSGKSTLAKILTGLYIPTHGEIFVDNQYIPHHNTPTYQQLFSAIYSDFYLFNQIIGKHGEKPDESLVNTWLDKLEMKQKLHIDNNIIKNTELSQGQKKRVAMLLAVAEEKSILLLDEWAADQDPTFRRYFYQEMIPTLQQMGKTLFIISHDNQYFDKADRLFEMRNGRLIELLGEARQHASQDAITHLQT